MSISTIYGIRRLLPFGFGVGAVILLVLSPSIAIGSATPFAPSSDMAGLPSSPSDTILQSCHPGNFTFSEFLTYNAARHTMDVYDGNGGSGSGGFQGVQTFSSGCHIVANITTRYGLGASALAYNTATHEVVVGEPDMGLTYIRNSSVVGSFHYTFASANSIAYDPAIAGVAISEGYFQPCHDQNVTFVTGTSVANHSVTGCPQDVVYSNGTNTLWVTTRGLPCCYSAGTLTALNATTGAVRSVTELSGDPGPLAYDPNDHKIYVTMEYRNATYVFNSSGTLVREIPLGTRVDQAIAFSPTTNEIYAVGEYSKTGVAEIAIIQDYSLVQTLSISTGDPDAVAYDAATGDMYVCLGNTFYYDPDLLIVS
jgi:hypothetical protein